MPTVVRPRRRRRRRKSRPWLVILAASALFLLALTAYHRLNLPEPRSAPPALVIRRSAAIRRGAGITYPYSIIPGGAYSRGELIRALERDPIAAAHYQGFRTESAAATPAASVRWAYVSYRLEDTVYWTRRPVRVRMGEVLIADGRESAAAGARHRRVESVNVALEQWQQRRARATGGGHPAGKRSSRRRFATHPRCHRLRIRGWHPGDEPATTGRLDRAGRRRSTAPPGQPGLDRASRSTQLALSPGSQRRAGVGPGWLRAGRYGGGPGLGRCRRSRSRQPDRCIRQFRRRTRSEPARCRRPRYPHRGHDRR